MSFFRHFRAMLWLHVVRSTRYLWGMLNWGIVDLFWMLIYVLGALAFVEPNSYQLVIPNIFWAIVAWNLMSTPTWTIGNWMRFYVIMGVFEEHELADASHTMFLIMRALPSLIVSAISTIGISVFLAFIAGPCFAIISNPLLMAFSLLAIFSIAVSYSLILAYLSLSTSTPAPLLDMLNFLLFIIGGIAVPVSRLPEPLKIVAIVVPYSHPSELMRLAATGAKPFLPATVEVFVTIVYALTLALISIDVEKRAIKSVRLNGVRGIGRT